MDADQSKSIVAAEHGSVANAVFVNTVSRRELDREVKHTRIRPPATRFEKCANVRVVYCANIIKNNDHAG